MKESIYVQGLQTIPKVGAVSIRSLIQYFGTPKRAWYASRTELEEACVWKEKGITAFLKGRELVDLQKEKEAIEALGISYVSFLDSHFPKPLQEIYHSPAGLFYKGVLPSWDRAIAVVGARKASPYGKNACRTLVKGMVAAKVVIISGGATGIDSIAHRAALEGKGQTVAVLGCGLDKVYPKENEKLFQEIIENGAILSEYPLGMAPLSGNFPARNRIISGLSKGVLVVEAALRSGSLITAELALQEGRDVFAVPGSIFSEQSQGTNHLIQEGACLVMAANDIVREYEWDEKEKVSLQVRSYTLEEHAVLDCLLAERAISIEEIMDTTGLPLKVILTIMVKLELDKQVERVGAQQYVRVMGCV